ncbi:MAG: amidohydrolase family protein [Anaerolineae bacterium]|nr:amidohydrolase family protein [Anaerolineae bacterium]
MDLIIRNAHVRGREEVVDIGILGERIAHVAPHLKEHAPREIDAEGMLVAPTFVEPHIHLDKALISEVVRPNVSGTLSEAIAITWDKKRTYTVEEVAARAERVIEWAVQHGTTLLRSHVDVDTIGGLTPLKGVTLARERYADLCEVQIVAFPQEGILQDPGTEDLLRQAMAAGADLVGGMPHNERTPEDGRRHIDICFAIAKEFNADIDMHVDETDDPSSRTLQYLAARTIEEGYQGRVTAGHTCALAAYDATYRAKVIRLLRQADVQMVANAGTNLMLQGRLDPMPIRRGVTPVKELLAAGVNVSYGQDCVKDTFYPTWGQADPLEVGLITAHAVQFTMPQDIETLFDMPTANAARLLRLPAQDYGVREGAIASLNIIAAANAAEAFRTRADRRYVIRRGRIVAETVTTRKVHRTL